MCQAGLGGGQLSVAAKICRRQGQSNVRAWGPKEEVDVVLCCYVMRCCSVLLAVVVSCGESQHPGVFAVAGAVGRGSGP